jgi:hypothetical protein
LVDVLAIEKERINLSKMNGYTLGIRTSSISINIINRVVITVQILQGDLEEVRSSKNEHKDWYRELPPYLRAQLLASWAHIALNEDNYEECLDYVERALELFAKIHSSNLQVFASALLSCLALYSLYEKLRLNIEKKSTLAQTMDHRKLKKNISNSSNIHKSSPSRSNIVVKSVRGPSGEISFQYRQSAAKNVSKTDPIDQLKQRIKTLSYAFANNLAPFNGHILTEPFVLLFRALGRLGDSGVSPNPNGDGPFALRFWSQKHSHLNTGDMKLIVALVAIKCWAASQENLEFTGDLNAGMAMLAELGLDGLCIF